MGETLVALKRIALKGRSKMPKAERSAILGTVIPLASCPEGHWESPRGSGARFYQHPCTLQGTTVGLHRDPQGGTSLTLGSIFSALSAYAWAASLLLNSLTGLMQGVVELHIHRCSCRHHQ